MQKMENQTRSLSNSQKAAFKALCGSLGNIFLTGGPGTGKSYLISEYLKTCGEKIPVVASTGAAAIIIGGRTFHSFFGLGIMQGGAEAVIEKAMSNSRLRKRLRDTITLVIDEISLISREALECAERLARGVRNNGAPWGGIRIIAVGDFAQLPPISKGPQRDWCFLSTAWKKTGFKRLVLKEVMRTHDREFLEVLEEIRWGGISERVEAFLNGRLADDSEIEADVPHLFPRRAETEAYNLARLSELSHPVKRFETYYEGRDHFVERLRRDAPIPAVLELKKEAIVMLRVNDPKQRYVNGSVGRIVEFCGEVLLVEINGREIEIPRFTFIIQDDEGEEAAFAMNFPVNLAYASTIHKVQGATLDRVHISLKGLWEPGQAYVALSRARSGSGITLMGWDAYSIKADPQVKSFYENEEEPCEDSNRAVQLNLTDPENVLGTLQ